MRISKAHSALVLSCALVLATLGCETTSPKRAAIAPPLRATAPTLAAAPPPKIEEKLVPRIDPVESLLEKVEKEYEAGQANYNAGHLEAARENFDRAVSLLLESSFDIRSDERLQGEFDKVIAGVSTLELEALKQGDGFTGQKAEPAPIDEANEITFPADPKIEAKAAEEVKQTVSDLPLTMNDEVAGYINFYSTRARGTLERALVRAGRYGEIIRRIFREEGVPQDLIYLAMAESGFHPLALSRAGARGMWQFMATRASGYGLQRNWWVDERQDPEKATRAAARHLKDLFKEFGDWYLAMAAYNSGPLNVQRGVERTGYADFWQLYKRDVLPRETKNYVPIILAMTIMAKNAAQYGFDQLVPEPPLRVDQVKVNYPVDLRLVAECVDTSLDQLMVLNPSLLRLTTPKEGEFELNLPEGAAAKFEAAIAAIPRDKRVWWRYHKVEPGDTLASVAKKYKTTAKAIARVNELQDSELAADTKLIIPVTPGKYPDALAYSRRPTRYRVRKGDTVLSVADDFGVPPERLRKWNHLRGNHLRKGRLLVIYRPAGPAVPGESLSAQAKSRSRLRVLAASFGKHRVHRVKAGETLYSIASQYNTSVAALRRNNRLASANLHPGEVLVISGR